MNNSGNDLEDIRKVIYESQSIAISGHTSPDGDAIGACAALGMSLSLMGKDVRILLETYSDSFDVIPVGGLVSHSAEDGYVPQLYIAVDCGDVERLGEFRSIFDKAENTVNIDHHKSNTFFAKTNFVDSISSSSSEIIFRLIDGHYQFNDDIAAALYAGIVFDTGGFRHTSTGAGTLKTASRLLEYDFNFNNIYNSLFYSRSFRAAKIMGVALSKLSEHFDGKVVASFVNYDDMLQCGANSDDVSEISGYLKSIKNTDVSVFIYEKKKGIFKVSMRSENGIDVAKVAVMFGGGGHEKAAGFTIERNIESVMNETLEKVGEQIRESMS